MRSWERESKYSQLSSVFLSLPLIDENSVDSKSVVGLADAGKRIQLKQDGNEGFLRGLVERLLHDFYEGSLKNIIVSTSKEII